MSKPKKNVLLAGEMGEDIDLTEEEARALAEPAETPAAAPPAPVASQPISITIADIQAIVKTAVEAASQGNANLADVVTQGIAQARKPIPEGTDASNPRISVFNILGDRDHPRPDLKCEFFIGTQEPKTGIISRTYPWLADDLTVQEIIALNTLEPVTLTVQRLDEQPMPVSIVPTKDAVTGALKRLVVVVPLEVIEKGSQLKNFMPGPINLVAQITGKNFNKVSNDELAWLMTEHRAKRYVSGRETVAA